jgi:hypothetical protein
VVIALVGCAFSSLVVAAPIGLVASYPFNGNANDESGNGNNGTVIGATPIADRYGSANSAYNFDGTNDYIRIADSSSLNITGDFTISAWIRTTAVGKILFSNMRQISPHDGYSFEVSNSGAMYAMSREVSLVGNAAVTSGTWRNVAVTLTGTSGRIYVDGFLDKTGTLGVPTSFSGDQTIGASYTPFYFFNGAIDDVQVFNRALSSAEIAQLVPEPTITPVVVAGALFLRRRQRRVHRAG